MIQVLRVLTADGCLRGSPLGQAASRLALASLLLVAASCQDEIAHQERLRPIKAIQVVASDLSSVSRTFAGTVQTAQELKLSFRVEGTLVSVPVAVGQRVSAGALIAALDAEPYRVALEEAKADLAQANASRRSSEAEYQRVRQLYAADNTSRTELDEALASAEASKADYDARSQALRRADLNLSYTQIFADRECSVAEVNVEVNENVAIGGEIARLNCGDAWEAIIDVPESQIAFFSDGMQASLRFPSIEGSVFEAFVSEVGVASAGNTSFPVTLRIADPPRAVRSNLAVEVSIGLSLNPAGTSTITLPSTAVSQDQGGTFVYLVSHTDEEGVAVLKRQPVVVGELTRGGLEIESGVALDQYVLTAGHANARDGMRVLHRTE